VSETKPEYKVEQVIDIDGEKYAVPTYAELAEMVYRLRIQFNKSERDKEMVRIEEAELEELRRDCADSQNHNEGVINRIFKQLQDAGYEGTLSEMVDAVLADAK